MKEIFLVCLNICFISLILNEYIKTLKDDLKHGQGFQTFENEEKYIGQW